MLPAFDVEARRAADQFDEQVERQIGGADGEPLLECVTGQIGKAIRTREQLGFAVGVGVGFGGRLFE